MTLPEALNIVIARTGHERFRFLCSEANPDRDTREGYRALVLRLAAQAPGDPPPELAPRPAPIVYAPRFGGCCG